MRTYLVVGFLCIISLVGWAQTPSVIINQASKLRLVSDAAIFIDPTNQVHIGELIRNPRRFRPIRSNVDFGRNRATNWLTFTIQNKQPRAAHYFAYIYYPRLEYIQAYALSPGQRLLTYPKTGWGVPLAQRPFPHPKNVLPITLAAGQQATIFLAVRAQYQRIIIPVSLHTHEQMLARIQIATLTDGIVSCILLFVCIISLAYFFDSTFTEWGNLWYGLYALCTFLFYLLRFDIQYLTQTQLDPLLNQYVDVFSTLILVFYCLSGYAFMSDVVVGQRFAKWYGPAMSVLALLGVSLLTIPTDTSLQLAVIVRIILSVVSIGGLLYVLGKGLLDRSPYARLFFWIFIPILVAYVALTYATDLSNGADDIDIDLKIKGVVFIETSLMMIGFIYKNNKVKRQLKQQLADQQTKTLVTQIHTQEAERQRLAADLHDDLGGTLATIRQRLSSIRQDLSDSPAARQLDALEPLIQKSGHDLRRIAHNLMPPDFDRLGLRVALEQFIRNQPTQPTRFSLIVAGQVCSLPAEIELNLYRIVSELVQNIHKHAQAKQAAVQLLYQDDRLTITVEDDGIGDQATDAHLKPNGIGLKNSSLRAEYIGAALWREAGKNGTLVVIDVPYPTSSDSAPSAYPNPADRRSPPVQ